MLHTGLWILLQKLWILFNIVGYTVNFRMHLWFTRVLAILYPESASAQWVDAQQREGKSRLNVLVLLTLFRICCELVSCFLGASLFGCRDCSWPYPRHNPLLFCTHCRNGTFPFLKKHKCVWACACVCVCGCVCVLCVCVCVCVCVLHLDQLSNISFACLYIDMLYVCIRISGSLLRQSRSHSIRIKQRMLYYWQQGKVKLRPKLELRFFFHR